MTVKCLKSLTGSETPYTNYAGNEGSYEYIFSPVFEADGRVEFVVGSTRDISERKRADREIRAMNLELDQRVATRTAELALTIKELEKTRGEADRANRAKSEFLSHMSHELRTPLNATLGFAQILQLGNLDANQSECVDNILTAGRHLLGLINEVLEITRIESGHITIQSEAFSLHRAVKECIGLLRAAADEQGTRITLLDSPKLIVVSDPNRLKQVILNLLGNALKFGRHGGKVTLNWKVAQGGNLWFGITDEGAGLTPEMVNRLFVPFERLDAKRRGIEGTGLGLVVTQRIIQAMGGTIGVESEVGNGSTFWFDIPAQTRSNIDEAIQ